MTTTYTSKDAPGFAKHSSTFRNDDRCYEVHYVVGDNYDDVRDEVIRLIRRDSTLLDYDVNFSTEGDAYVGVTVRDY